MGEFSAQVLQGVRAVEGRFDPQQLEGRTILSSDWAIGTEVIIEGEELPKGVTAKVTSTGASVNLTASADAPVKSYKDMFLVTARNEAGESVPFSKKGDGGKLVTTRDGHVVGVVCGGGMDKQGRHDTVLVPAEQFNIGMPA